MYVEVQGFHGGKNVHCGLLGYEPSVLVIINVSGEYTASIFRTSLLPTKMHGLVTHDITIHMKIFYSL
jgi:hypothetical protein